jgi:hypothetical protein
MVAAFPESKKECEAVKARGQIQSGRRRADILPRASNAFLPMSGRGALDARPDGMLYVGAHDVVAAYYFQRARKTV